MRRTVAVVFAAFASAHFLSTFVRSANAVIADDLVRDIGLSASELGLMTSLLFLVFAAVQLPLGAALDRWGARWVTSATMLAAVAGSLVFAVGESFGALAVGRALMGVGTAGILMGGLKALSGYLSTRRFAAVSGTLVAVGSSGALVAATPLAWLAGTVGWRLVFVGGSVALLAAAAGVAAFGRSAPDAGSAGGEATDAESTAPPASRGGFGEIFRHRRFWPLAAMAISTTGVSFSFQALWAGPYLVDGRAMASIAAGNVLFALSLGVVLGYLLWGWLGERWGPARALAVAAAVFIASQVALGVLPPVGSGVLTALFFLFGITGSASVLLFVLVRTLYPFELTGRAVTAVNLFMFGGGFALQWALGILVEWAAPAGGGAPPSAYGAMFLIGAGMGVAALAWFLRGLPAWRRDVEGDGRASPRSGPGSP